MRLKQINSYLDWFITFLTFDFSSLSAVMTGVRSDCAIMLEGKKSKFFWLCFLTKVLRQDQKNSGFGSQCFPPTPPNLRPGLCIGSVSAPFYYWVAAKWRRLSHVNRPVMPSLSALRALSNEEEQGVVSSPTPSTCKQWKETYYPPVFFYMFFIPEVCYFGSSF